MHDRKNTHRVWMFKILKHLYSQKRGKHLGFKWGTALYFFHQLPRFSVDLDIDILPHTDMTRFPNWISSLETFVQAQWWTIKKSWTSAYSHHYFIQYGGEKKLKLEFTTHQYPNIYRRKQLLGLQIQVMDIRDMFAHKLCAFVSRYQQRGYLASRDLFDMHFLFQQSISPREEIIKIRSKNLVKQAMSTKQRYAYLLEFIRTHETYLRHHILDGIWELIEQTKTKHHIKTHLLDELIEYLQLGMMG